MHAVTLLRNTYWRNKGCVSDGFAMVIPISILISIRGHRLFNKLLPQLEAPNDCISKNEEQKSTGKNNQDSLETKNKISIITSCAVIVTIIMLSVITAVATLIT